MARQLSASAIAAKNADHVRADWLVESPTLGLALSHALESPGAWEHRLLSIAEIEHAVPAGGGVGAISSLDVTLVENHAGMSLRAIWDRTGMLEGQPVSLSLLFQGEAYADKIPLFSGQIDKTGWANGEGTLQAVDTTLPADILVPTQVVTRESFGNAPDQAINQALPLVYGLGAPGRLPLAPLLLTDGLTLLEYRMAGHAVARMGTVYGVWPTGARAIRTDIAASVNAEIAEIRLEESIVGTIFKEPNQPLTIGRQIGVTDPTFALDPDPATLTLISTRDSIAPDFDGQGLLGLQVALINPESVNVVVVTLKNYRRAPMSLTTVVALVRLRLLNTATGAVVHDNLWNSPPFRHVSNPKSDVFTVKPISLDGAHTLEALLDVQNEGGRGTVDDYFEVGEFRFEVGYQPDSALEPLFVDATTIGEGSQEFEIGNLVPSPLNNYWAFAFGTMTTPEESAGFTGRLDEDGAITGNPGAHIENPADVIRSLLVDEMGRTADTASFNTARALQDDHFFDGGVGYGWFRDRAQAREILADMALQARSYLLPIGDGSFRLHVYNANAAPEFSFTQDYVLLTSSGTNGERTSSLTIEMSNIDLVANTFRVRYGWHPGLRQFTQVCYATPAGSNHSTLAEELTIRCTDSESRYGPRQPWEYDAYWITHKATAEKLLEHRVKYFWSQHVFASFNTTMAACHLEPSDLVTFTHPELPALDNAQKWEVLRWRCSPSEGVIFLVLGRLAALSFTYFAIRDQDSDVWYWNVNDSTGLSWSGTPPQSPHRQAVDLGLSPIPYWLEVVDTEDVHWFIYPSRIGEPTAELIAPPIGPGRVGSPILHGLPPGAWQIVATPIGEVDVLPA